MGCVNEDGRTMDHELVAGYSTDYSITQTQLLMGVPEYGAGSPSAGTCGRDQ